MFHLKRQMLLGIVGFLWGLNVVQAQNVGIGTTNPQAQLHVQISDSYYQPALIVEKKGLPTPYLLVTSDGNVGIGVSAPSEALDVSGNIMFSGALMPAGNAGTSGQVLISQGPGSPPLWVDAPSIGDNWGSQVAVTQTPIIGDGTTTNPITVQSGTNAGDILVWNGSQWQIQQPGTSTGIAPLCQSPSINFLQKWTGTDLCNSQIYDNGTNVGIGTSSPSEKLDIAGNLKFSGAIMPGGNAGTSGYVLTSQGPGVAPTWTDPTTFGDNWGSQVAQTQNPIIGDGTSGNPITFASGTSADQVWKWDGSQWVLAKDSVGDNWGSQVAVTTSPVVGDGTSGNPISIKPGNGTGDILIWNGTTWQIKQPGTSTGIAPICSSPTANLLPKWTGTNLCNSQIYDNGTNVGIGTTSPTYKLHVNGRIKSIGINETSDERLKTDVYKIDHALNMIIQLEGVYYRWKDSLIKLGYPSKLQAGFIAQQVKEILPMVVEQDKEGFYSVEYTRIVPFLVEAIKELYEQNQILKEEINRLKKNNSSTSSTTSNQIRYLGD